jgi:general secretion pathway protein K
MKFPRERGANGNRGFALLAVSITIATLALIVAAVGEAAHRHVVEARGGLARLRVDSAVSGAITTVAAGLADGSLSPEVFAHGQTVTIGAIAVNLSVRPEAAKIDLNAAPPALLTALFQAVGVDGERAAKLADAIEDWRDADTFASANGAEISDYLSAGRDYGPTNESFESVSELGLVLGADEALVQCVAPDLTVFTNLPNVDSAYASKHIRDALGIRDTAGLTIPLSGLSVQPGVVFDLVAHATGEDGIVVSREAILRLTGSPRDPVWTLASVAPAPDAATADAACKTFAAENKQAATQ